MTTVTMEATGTLDFEERRSYDRRASHGRRVSDLTEQCGVHGEAMRRLDERCADRKAQSEASWEDQKKVNEAVFAKIDGIGNKLNWVLGAAYVLWPLLLLLAQHYMRK